MSSITSRIELINEFDSAPETALFNQISIAAVLDCSKHLLERQRWVGAGVPYLKLGGRVRYRKKDVLDYLDKNKSRLSTSQIV